MRINAVGIAIFAIVNEVVKLEELCKTQEKLFPPLQQTIKKEKQFGKTIKGLPQ